MRPAPPVEERFAHCARSTRGWRTTTSRTARGAAIEFRKHLGWYVKGLPGSAELRKKLYAVESVAQIEQIFGDYLAAYPNAAPTDFDSQTTAEDADAAVAAAA